VQPDPIRPPCARRNHGGDVRPDGSRAEASIRRADRWGRWNDEHDTCHRSETRPQPADGDRHRGGAGRLIASERAAVHAERDLGLARAWLRGRRFRRSGVPGCRTRCRGDCGAADHQRGGNEYQGSSDHRIQDAWVAALPCTRGMLRAPSTGDESRLTRLTKDIPAAHSPFASVTRSPRGAHVRGAASTGDSRP
jgi:hypothetical protein